MVDHIHALPEGYTLQEYTITGVLGFGGFGITYSAHDGNLDKLVAIKEYLPSELAARVDGSTVSAKSGQDAEHFQWGLERFLDEARTVARFDHPNIVRIHRFFELNNTGYIVMEFIDGQTLADVLRREDTLSEAEIRTWLWPVIDGLKMVHDQGYLHRDIKPQNIMMRADGRPCLLDFGAARVAVGGVTQSLTSVMTPGFAPLEQYQTRGQGPWTDVYSLAAVIYKCMTGLKPQDALNRISDDELVSPASLQGRSYSGPLIEAVMAALAVQASERPQSLDAWLQIADGSSPAATVIQPRATTRKQPQPPGRSIVPVEAPPAPPAAVDRDRPDLGSPESPRSRKRLYLGVPILLVALTVAAWGVTAYQDLQDRKAELERQSRVDLEAKRLADQQERDRLLAENRAAQEKLAALEREKQEREEAQRKEKERLAAIEAENKRKADEAARVERERQAAIEAENQRIADEKARLAAQGLQLPVWAVGDRWAYESAGGAVGSYSNKQQVTGESTVSGLQAYQQGHETEIGETTMTSTEYYDKSTLNILMYKYGEHETTWSHEVLEGVEWPKPVGNRWKTRTSFRNGEDVTVNITSFEVVGMETITTPAGTFECYKIVSELTNHDLGFDQTGTMWFNAEVKNYVKIESTTFWHESKQELMGSEPQSSTRVLMSYQVSHP